MERSSIIKGVLFGLVLLVIVSTGFAEECWDYSSESTCEANDCFWDQQGQWCGEKGCWNLWTESQCSNSTDTVECNWRTQDSSWGWCERVDCWGFSGSNQSFCESNPYNLDCSWETECTGPGQCWGLDQVSCGNTSGCSWGNCLREGCWDQTTQSSCEAATGFEGQSCKWNSNGNYCYEPGCWDYTNRTACEANSCNWEGSGETSGWCGKPGCWDFDFTNASACVNNSAGISCTWGDPYCNDQGCWNNNDQSSCNAQNGSGGGESCYWRIDTGGSGWCEEVGCWTFEHTNQSACENNTVSLNCVWDNSSGGEWCYQNVSALSCPSITNEKKCYDTYYCWWDFAGDGGNGSCETPEEDNFFEVWNPGCYIFDNNESNCNATLGCTWSGSSCNSNTTINNEGLGCANINDSNLCNNIASLGSCCSWQGGSCTTNQFSIACWDNLQEPPEGATFCEDWKAYDSETLCTQIAGDPWYMPCKWNNNSDHCEFDGTNVFGEEGGGFDDINNRQNCEYAGGVWLQEFYCSGNKSVSSGRCEYKFDGETNCNKACFACEKQTDGQAWTTIGNAKTACQDSALGFCEFREDGNAPNGYGFCEPKQEFVKSGGKSCDQECGSCTHIGDILEGEPQEACKKSSANCKWFSDPGDNTKGFCASASEKSCSDRCDKCYDQNACVQYGKGGDNECTWDETAFVCKNAGQNNDEFCFDGIDNDGDGNIDCADSNCFSDPFCGGGFFGGADCFGFSNTDTCTSNGCAWIVEDGTPNGGFCDNAGALCFEYDGTNQTSCENQSLVGAECEWHIGFGGGFCEVPEDEGEVCWSGLNQSSCEANANCVWSTDPWCEQNPESCGNNTGWCDFAAFSCWKFQNESVCSAQSYCNWNQDEFGGWCDNKCFQHNLNQTTCETISLTSNLTCEWIGGLCDPAGFGGGGGGGGSECFLYDGNQSSCTNQTGCSWFEFGDAFCDVDFSSNCPEFSNNETACNAATNCKWTGNWCDNSAFECHWNASLSNNETACNAHSSCEWVSDSWGDRCEPICFGGNLHDNQTACNADSSCRWISGMCEPSLGASLFQDIQGGAPVPLGSDTSGDGASNSTDIVEFGMKDMGSAFGFGITVSDFTQAAVCNGQPLPFAGTGKGNETTKFYYYLDTDGSSTGNCATQHNSSIVGFEFQLSYVAEQSNTSGSVDETFTAKKCVDGSWGSVDIKLTSNKFIMCSEISGGMVAIDKADLNKFSTLFSSTADIRVVVTTANANGNVSSPGDTASAGYGTPGAIDFKFENCWDKGADGDGDGILAESDPDCANINQHGFVPFEDCFPNNIDEDGNGLTDCFDSACKDFQYCIDNELGLNDPDFVDTSAPTITAIKSEKYYDSALVMYDSNEPANGKLSFYGNDSSCKTLNTTVYDPGMNLSGVKTYKVWHEGELHNDGGTYSLDYDLSSNTTYYYKLTLCDDSSNCAVSACLNFKTTTNTTCGACDFVANVKPPQGWNVSYDLDQDGTFDQQGLACGNAANAGTLTNYTEARSVDIKIELNDSSTYIEFINASLTKTVLNNKVRTISGEDNIKAGNTTDSNGNTINYGGLDRETRDKLINALRPEACDVKMPGDGTCAELWHCDDNLTNCVDRTADATLVETGADYCIWRVPFCEFSTWAGGQPGSGSSESSSSSSGGGGGGGGGSAAASTLPSESRIVTGIVAGEPRDISYSSEGIDVAKISLSATEDLDQLGVTVRKETTVSVIKPGETVYSYMDLSSDMEDKIDSATVTFRVLKSWYIDNNIERSTTQLMRYENNRWAGLTTQQLTSGEITGLVIGESLWDKIIRWFSGITGNVINNEDYYFFSAETNDFGLFAVTGDQREVSEPIGGDEETTEEISVTCSEGAKRCSGNVVEICNSDFWIRSEVCEAGCNSVSASCNAVEESTIKNVQVGGSGFGLWTWWIIVIVIVLGTGYLFYHQRQKNKYHLFK